MKLRVEALSGQASLMTENQKQLVFTSFIFSFLSRVDLPGTKTPFTVLTKKCLSLRFVLI